MDRQWSVTNIPPIGHEDVADFAYLMFTIAKAEKDRLNKHNDFLANYALYRGDEKRQQSAKKGAPLQGMKGKMPLNLFFSNVERTVSVIAAQNPTGEVVDMDGIRDGAENVMSTALSVWWDNTNQWQKTRDTARQMEIYGATIEHPTVDATPNISHFKMPNIDIIDPFAFYPAPGYWEDLSTDCPYICLVGMDYTAAIETRWNVSDVASENGYELLGVEREDFKPMTYGSPNRTMGNYASAMTITRVGDQNFSDRTIERCLPIELWIHDKREVDGKMVCRDGVRKITIVKSNKPPKNNRSGYIVLDDCVNPNINPALSDELAARTYPWGRLPFYHANSYRDGISIWGFSAAEQVGDLIVKINQIVAKLVAYVINVVTPPLIIQKHCGITREMIESSIQKAGRLVLMPTVPNARIEFMQIPNLPATFFQVLDFIIKMYDRIYSIEDADRGKNPSGVRAASAIVALQERNQIVMKPKTAAIETIVVERSRWSVGFWQNFGTTLGETINVNEEQAVLVGAAYAQRRFDYVIEAGSMMPKTKLQIQELAKWLWTSKAISQRGLLEGIGWPDWKQEIARTADNQLDQALNVLIDAGLPQELAAELKKNLIEYQQKNEIKAKSGETPIALQGV